MNILLPPPHSLSHSHNMQHWTKYINFSNWPPPNFLGLQLPTLLRPYCLGILGVVVPSYLVGCKLPIEQVCPFEAKLPIWSRFPCYSFVHHPRSSADAPRKSEILLREVHSLILWSLVPNPHRCACFYLSAFFFSSSLSMDILQRLLHLFNPGQPECFPSQKLDQPACLLGNVNS